MNYLKRNVNYKKHKPVIGLYADSFNGKTGATTPYMNFAKLFGKVKLITTEDTFENIKDTCDVLLVPGGADVNPMRYGEAPHDTTSRTNVHYEWMDLNILKPWLKEGKPTIGICRGFQTINVLLGGTLFQNISNHVQSNSRSSLTDTMLVSIPNAPDVEYRVNTLHHQAVKDISNELLPIGFCPVYENCESLEHTDKLFIKPFSHPTKTNPDNKQNYYSICEAYVGKTKPIFAVQYHPEEINCPFAIETIDNMLNTYFT